MIFRTNQLYYLLTPVFWKRNVLVLVGLLLLVVVFAIGSGNSIVFTAVTALLFGLIYSAFVLRHLPKRFSVSEGVIRTQNKKQEYEDPRDPIECVELYGVNSLLCVQEQLKAAFPKAEHVNV